jgi:hypothetical protein
MVIKLFNSALKNQLFTGFLALADWPAGILDIYI